MPETEARTREPKTATVERREASVPRHGTQGASLGAWRAASWHAQTGVPPSTRTSLGAPPPLDGVSEAKRQSPDAEMRARERDGLFDMVKNAAGDALMSSPRIARRRRASTRLCWGPMITGRCSWVPALAALGRDDALIGWRKAPTYGCRKRGPAKVLCFAPVLYREPCNSNVSSRNGGHFCQKNPTAF